LAELPRDIVLLVDDSPEALGFLTDALEQSGFSVLIATSVNRTATQTRNEVEILTWSIFRIEPALTMRERAPFGDCLPERAPGLRLAEGQVVIPGVGGTATIDGVSVTQEGGWAYRIQDQRRYVFSP